VAKYIPLSLVLLTVILAAYLGGKPRGAKSLRTLLVVMAVYIAVWGWMCLNVYTQYVFIE
jgi:hypothetical protein